MGEMNVFQKILYLWNYSFYAEVLFLLIDVIAIYVIFRSKKTDIRKLFLIYTASAFLLFAVTDIIFCLYGIKSILGLWELMNLIFATIELFVFYLFYSPILQLKTYDRISKGARNYVILAAILVGFILLISSKSYVLAVAGYFNVLCYFLLLIPPLLYFYTVLNENKELDRLNALLSIWIFVYCMVSIFPTALEGRFLNSGYKTLYRIFIATHYVALSFLCYILVSIVREKQLMSDKIFL